LLSPRRSALVVLLASGLAVSAPSTSQAALPELAGTTTVTGRGYVDVRVARDVTVGVSPFDDFTFELSGGNLAAGVMIRGLGPPRSEAIHVMAMRFAPSIFCSGACTNPVNFQPIVAENAPIGSGGATLKAGDYRIYVLSDGPPATVKMRVPELGGETDLALTHSTRMEALVLSRRDNPRNDNLAVLGGTGELYGNGAFIHTWTSYRSPNLALVNQFCIYGGRPTGMAAFYPGCPATGGDDVISSSVPNPGVFVTAGRDATSAYQFATAPDGEYSVGGSLTSIAGVVSLGWAAFFVSFDGTPLER